MNILPGFEIVLPEEQRSHPPTDSKKLKKSPSLEDGNVIDWVGLGRVRRNPATKWNVKKTYDINGWGQTVFIFKKLSFRTTVAAAYMQNAFANYIFACKRIMHISGFVPRTRMEQNSYLHNVNDRWFVCQTWEYSIIKSRFNLMTRNKTK